MKVRDILIRELRKNSRKKLTAIAKEHNVAVTTLYDNYFALLKQGVFKKHVALVDYKQLSYFLHVHLIINGKTTDELIHSNCVNSCSKIQDGFYLECLFKNMSELVDYIEKLENSGAKKIIEHHIIEEIEKEKFIPSSMLS